MQFEFADSASLPDDPKELTDTAGTSCVAAC
jgi:hypothetical protein